MTKCPQYCIVFLGNAPKMFDFYELRIAKLSRSKSVLTVLSNALMPPIKPITDIFLIKFMAYKKTVFYLQIKQNKKSSVLKLPHLHLFLTRK